MRRECGNCTICCKLLPLQTRPEQGRSAARLSTIMVEAGLISDAEYRQMMPDFDKPAGQRCPHQRQSKGCAVYDKRPMGCRFWNCRWLVNDDTADLSRPDRSHYVIDIMPDYVEIVNNQTGQRTSVEVVQIWVDPKHPDAWREPHLLDYIERRGKEGKASIIRWSSGDAVTVFPPAMSEDGRFHEIRGNMVPERSSVDRLEGVARASHVKLQF